ncbi:filamentous hemagglutinin N-terminal domain-containing protein [Agrobacterium tumefaciens]|nr:filamentous hemagglutinin N-terminal domain-containing protein [Agrobacterium tumefaciens]
MNSLIKRFISSFMAGLIAFQPVLVRASDISNVRPDTGPRPHLDQSYNGSDVLNIARPNDSGVSHDVYNRFSAGDLILNNSPVNSKTQLGGWIEGNPNFQRGDAAKLWIGEVIGGSASQLNGVLEAAGSKLDIVLANEYGITCNGCGFVNTDRVTLSTGVPRFSASGAFEGLDVRQGTVTIGEAGLNPETRVSLSDVSRVDVIARAAAVYGKLRAQNLNIVAGSNAVDYNWSYDAATGQVNGVRPLLGKGDAPALAVDVSALGGMYANAIQMIATERGVGVRLDGTRASGSDIVLDASGRLNVVGQGIQVKQQVIARAKGPILLEGSIISENNDLVRVETRDTLTVRKQVSGGAVILEGAGDTFIGAVVKGRESLDVRSVAGNTTIAADASLTAAKIEIAAGNSATVYGSVKADETLRIAATDQAVTADGAQIGGKNVTIEGGTVHTGGRIDPEGDLTIRSVKEATNTGELSASGVSVISGTNFTNRGTIVARDIAKLDVGTLRNSGKITGTSLTGDARGDIENSGVLAADGAINLKSAGALSTLIGSDISGQDVDLSGDRIDHTGTLVARESASLIAGPAGLDNRGTIKAQSALLESAAAITNGATIATDGKTTINAATRFDALAGSVLRGGSLVISADTVSTAATIAGVDRVDIVAGSGGLDQRGTLGGGVVAITSTQGTIANSGIISAGTLLTAETQSAITNAAVLISGKDMRLFARQIFNNGGVIWANNSVTLAANAALAKAQLVRNETGRIEAFQGDLVIRADEVLNLGKAPSLSTGQIIKWTEKGESEKINPLEQIVKLIEPTFLGADGKVLPQYAGAYAALWADVVRGGKTLSDQSRLILKQSVTTESGASLADNFQTLWSGMFARANAAGTPDPAQAMRALVNPAIFDANGVVLPTHASAYAALWETLASGGSTVSNAVKAILKPSSLVVLEQRTDPVTRVVTTIYSNTLVNGAAGMWAAMMAEAGASYDIVKILYQDRFAKDGRAAEFVAGRNIDIEAGKIDNIHGTVSAGKDIRIVANEIRNEALGASQFLVEVHKKPSCFTCHSGKTEFYDTFGGRIEANGKLSIQGNLQNITSKSSELSTADVLQKLNDYIAQKKAEGDADLAGVPPATRKNFEFHENRKDDFSGPVQGDGNDIRTVKSADTGSSTTVDTGTDPAITAVDIAEIANSLKLLGPIDPRLDPTATVDMLLSAGLNTLAETNPEYTEYANFITSNYMMKQGRLAYRDDIVNNTQETIRTALSKAEQRTPAVPDTAWRDKAVQVPAPDGSGMRTVYPASEPLTLNPGGALIRASEVNVAGGRIETSGRIEGLRGVSLSANIIEAKGGAITAADGKVSLTSGGSTLLDQTVIDARAVDIVAGRDFTGKAISISARENASILAAAGVSITSLEQRLSGKRGNAVYTTVSHSTSSLKAGGDLSIVSLGDLTLAGVEAKAGGSLSLTAMGDVTLAPVENSLELKDHAKKSRLDIYELDSIVTSLSAGSDVSITAGGGATLIGTDIDSGGKVRIAAGNDVVLGAAQDIYSYERETKSGNWFRKKQTRESETRVTNTGTDISTSGDIEVVSAAGNLVTAGSRFASTEGNVALKAVKGDIFAGTYTDIFRKTHESRKSYLGGLFSSNSRSLTENRFATGTAALAGLDLTLVSGGDTTLVGTQLKAGGRLSVETGGDFSITAAISSMRKEYFSHRVGAITMTTITENSFKEIATAATLIAGGGIGFEIRGKASLTLYDYAGVDSKELRTLYPDELLKIAGLELIRKPLADEYFYDKKVALSPAFKAVLAIVLSNYIIGPALALSAATWQVAAATTFVVGSIDGAVSGKFDIGAILKDTAFAGLTAGLTSAISLKIPEGSLLNQSLLGGLGNGQLTMGNILNGALDGIIKSGLSSTFYGTDFGTGFTKELLNTVVSLAMADVQGAIGDLGLRLGFEDGSLPSMLLHGAVGCAAASATGDACAAGAAGAMAQSLYAGYVKSKANVPKLADYATPEAYQDAHDNWRRENANRAAVVGAAAGYFLSEGKGSNVSAAASIARSGFENNYLGLHDIEAYKKALATCESAADYKACADRVWRDGGFAEIYVANQQSFIACMAANDYACVDRHVNSITEARTKALELRRHMVNRMPVGTVSDPNAYALLQIEAYYGVSVNDALLFRDRICGGVTTAECKASLNDIGDLRNEESLRNLGLLLLAGTAGAALAPEIAAACLASPLCVRAITVLDTAGTVTALQGCAEGDAISCAFVPKLGKAGGYADDVAGAGKVKRTVSVDDIPSIGPTPGKGGFSDWFDDLNADDFVAYWSNPATKAKMQRLLREPGGFHEWAMVSRADKFHDWGFSARDIWSFRTSTKNLTWINPQTGLPGKHGGSGSGTFHFELGQLIDNSSNVGELNSGLISLGHRWNIPNISTLIRK